MRGWLSTVLAAVIGGGVTAAVLLGTGAVDSGAPATATRPPLKVKGTQSLADTAGGGLGAREIYKRDAPGVVFIRAQTVRTDPTPFDLFETVPPTEATGTGSVLAE